jgi:hypothetical protein
MSSSSSSAKPPQGQRPHEGRRGRHSEVAHLLPFSMRRNKTNKSTSLFCACWSPTPSVVKARGGSAAQRRCPGTGAQWREGDGRPVWRARVPAQEPSAGARPFYMHVLAVRRRRSSKHVAHVPQARWRTRCVWRASVQAMCSRLIIRIFQIVFFSCNNIFSFTQISGNIVLACFFSISERGHSFPNGRHWHYTALALYNTTLSGTVSRSATMPRLWSRHDTKALR